MVQSQVKLRCSNPSIRFGLDTFQEAMKIVHKADESLINWTQFRYMVFDVPTHNGCYEERYKLLGMLASL